MKKCPIGLDDNSKICSAGTCDICSNNEPDKSQESQSELTALLYKANKTIQERQNVWRSFFQSYGIDLDIYRVSINSKHKDILPPVPNDVDVVFSDSIPEGKICAMLKFEHADIKPFGDPINLL
jgi:hypothetical protein